MSTARADQLIRRALGEEEEPKQPTEFHFGLIAPNGDDDEDGYGSGGDPYYDDLFKKHNVRL